MASKRLGVPTEQLAVADGVVTVRTDPSKKVGYGELIGDRKFNMALSGTAKRKNPRDWKILGTPVPRCRHPRLCDGPIRCVHNVRVPGMVHGPLSGHRLSAPN